MPAENVKLGPGTLTIGATGSEIDISCQINNAVLQADKNETDATVKLCGDSVAGSVSYAYHLSGNMDLDVATVAGFFQFSQEHAGELVDFEFCPNTAATTTASGTLIVDPLPFGGDAAGEVMAGDFDFTISGVPVYVFPT